MTDLSKSKLINDYARTVQAKKAADKRFRESDPEAYAKMKACEADQKRLKAKMLRLFEIEGTQEVQSATVRVALSLKTVKSYKTATLHISPANV